MIVPAAAMRTDMRRARLRLLPLLTAFASSVAVSNADETAAWVKAVPIRGEAAAAAVPRLIAIARDPEQPGGLRTQVMLKLPRLGRAGRDAVPALLRLAGQPDPIGRAAVKSLSQFGPLAPDAEPLFRQLLDDPERRPLAIEGLVRLAGVSGSAFATVAAELDDPVTLAVLPTADPGVLRAMQPRLRRLFPFAPDAVAPLLDSSLASVQMLVDELIRQIDADQQPTMVEPLAERGEVAAPLLQPLLRSGDPAFERAALRSLRGVTLPVEFVAPLLNSPDAAVRIDAAVQALGRTPPEVTPAVEATLVEALAGEPRLARETARLLQMEVLPASFRRTLEEAIPMASRQFRTLARQVLEASK